MTRDDATVNLFRSAGQQLQRGIPVTAPSLPRSRRLRMALELEAGRDSRVRTAYDAALANAERARQLKPRVLVRNSGTILKIV
jgi:hypothetical protein